MGTSTSSTEKNLSICEHLIGSLNVPIISNCSQCYGTGFIYENYSRKMGGYTSCSCIAGLCGQKVCLPPYEFYQPEIRAMKPCSCRSIRSTVRKIQYLEKKAYIPRRYKGFFLDHIRLDHAPASSGLFTALDYAEEIVSKFGSQEWNPKGLYLYGGTGRGKTLISCAILNELLRFHKISVRFAKINRDILRKLRSSFNPNSEIYGEGLKIEEELAEVKVLVVDDFGVQQETQWVVSVLYDLIDTRYENNLLTILTSNEPMSFWKETAGGRIYSRLQEMCREIHIDAPDYRLSFRDATKTEEQC